MFTGRSIDVRATPGVVRNPASSKIRAVPKANAPGRLYQSGKSFAGRRIASGIEVEKIKGG
jgi:hypothetical protein